MISQPKQRPNLVIETNSDENEQKSDTKYILPSIKSVKNSHEMKKFNFNQVKTVTPFDRIIKIDRIEKLEKEKKQLLESLQILKNGAVNAIVQKQEIIDKLRKLFNQGYVSVGGDRDDSKVQQLETLLQYIRDLEDERKELKDELERARLRFQMQIQEKQQIIQEMTNELNWSIQRIDNLQKYDRLLQQKIKVMEQSNQNLSVLLNQSQQSLKDERKKFTEESQLLKNRSSESFNQVGSDSQNGSSLNRSSIRKLNHGSEKDLNISLSRSLDESIIQTKIQQMKNQHLVQIQDLTQFYEGRIQSLMKLCDKYPEPFYEKTNNTKLSNNNNVAEVQDNTSNYSGFTNQIREQKNRDAERVLKKNLSLGSFKSGILRMDPIDEKDEIQTPGRTLRKQLSQFQYIGDGGLKKVTSQASIAHSSSSKSSSKKSNQQKQSQFSYKYFEYPASSFKKNKSQVSNTKSEASTPRKTPKVRIEDRLDNKQILIQKQEEKGSHVWDKLFWFASGTLTGGLLLKYGNKLFK